MSASSDPILEALSRALLDPTPRILIGSAKSPGIFVGTAKKLQPFANKCETSGWIAQTGEIDKKKKPLYRITEEGRRHALEHSEPVTLLREIRDNIQVLVRLKDRVDTAFTGLAQQQKTLQAIEAKLAKPPRGVTTTASVEFECKDAMIGFIREYSRDNPTAYCPLPELYMRVVKPRDLSIGQFHDAIRELTELGKIRLFPYTRPFYTLIDEQCAMVAGQEIKYYAQLSDSVH